MEFYQVCRKVRIGGEVFDPSAKGLRGPLILPQAIVDKTPPHNLNAMVSIGYLRRRADAPKERATGAKKKRRVRVSE